jgi:hypothetical protein
VESEPPRGAGISKARSTSIFAFLDLFRGAPFDVGFRRRVFFIKINCERSYRTDESPTQDFQPSHGASTVGVQELKASALLATYTLAAISLASGQSSNESLSKCMQGHKDGESQVGLTNTESNNASVLLNERSTMSALGIIAIKRGDKACTGSNSCEACA